VASAQDAVTIEVWTNFVNCESNRGAQLAKPNYQFEKRQRDLAKKKKQDEKRQRKLDKKDVASEDNAPPPEDGNSPAEGQ